jgi:hypothetical protein
MWSRSAINSIEWQSSATAEFVQAHIFHQHRTKLSALVDEILLTMYIFSGFKMMSLKHLFLQCKRNAVGWISDKQQSMDRWSAQEFSKITWISHVNCCRVDATKATAGATSSANLKFVRISLFPRDALLKLVSAIIETNYITRWLVP